MTDQVAFDPKFERLHTFDAENNVEPTRTIAERIGWKYGCDMKHSLVDEISNAIEDARAIGEKRALAGDDLADLARNVAGFDDRLLLSADLNLLRSTLREYRHQARAAIAKATGAQS